MNLAVKSGNLRAFLDYAILICVCFYVLGHFSLMINAIKNIGIYGAVVFCALYIVKFKDEAVANFKRNINENKTLVVLVVAFYFVIFAMSIFPYSSDESALKIAFKELKKGMFLFVVLLFRAEFSRQISAKWVFYALILAFVMRVFKDFAPLLHLSVDAMSAKTAIVDRYFSSYFDYCAPFALVALFVLRGKAVKFSLLAIFILAIAMDVLTGARGSWVAFVLSAGVTLGLIGAKRKFKLGKNSLVAIALLTAILCGALAWGYANLGILKFKFTQTSSSGRDIIIAHRLPELLASKHALIGLGHGDYQYQRFFNDIATQKRIDTSYDGYFGPNGGRDEFSQMIKFWHDEPTFLAAYYHYGVFAILMPILAGAILVRGVRAFWLGDNYYALGVAMSVFSFYFVRGLFEGYGVMNLFVLASLMLIFGGKIDKYSRT